VKYLLKIGLQNDQLRTKKLVYFHDKMTTFQIRRNLHFLSPFMYFFHFISGLNCTNFTPLRLLNLHMSHTVLYTRSCNYSVHRSDTIHDIWKFQVANYRIFNKINIIFLIILIILISNLFRLCTKAWSCLLSRLGRINI